MKIRIVYAPRVNPEFATSAELRDALLASYPDAEYFGGPDVGYNRDDTKPAWGWVVELIRMRSDWWPAIGIALQHAATDGGELARTALADLLVDYRDSLALAPWTDALARVWPDLKSRSTGTGWGVPDLRLETIIRDRRRYLEHLQATSDEVFLLGYGRGGKSIEGALTNAAELQALLHASARAGQFPDGDKGPWSWLGFELLTRGEWLWDALVRAALELDAHDIASVCALLDWFSEQRDLWRFEPLLASWSANPPSWTSTPAKTKPKSWRRTIRSAWWPEIAAREGSAKRGSEAMGATLGDVAEQAMWRARQQLATPAILDLPRLYG